MENGQLQVGFGRRCITPQESVPLGGYGNVMKRMSQNVLTDLFTTCVAMTDEQGRTLLLFYNDMMGSAIEVSMPWRVAVSQATGVPVDHIMMTATHSHSAPAYNHTSEPCVARYNAMVQEQMVKAAVEAMADRAAASMYFTKGKTKSLNFVRHYVMENGGYRGDNFGDGNPLPYQSHTTIADPEMRIVKFQRQGKKAVWLINWQSHPHRTGGSKKYDVSADIIGVMRDQLEQKEDCLFAFYNGGAGNVNPISRIKEENIYADYLQSGAALAQHAVEAARNFAPAKAGPIRVLYHVSNQPLNRPDEELYRKSKEIAALWHEINDYKAMIPYCAQRGINSPYAANAFISKYNSQEDEIPLHMYAISIGELAIVTAPYEMFDTNAKYIRDHSPYKMTFVIGYANDSKSYIPSAYGYIHGCYEADCTRFRPGTGEVLAKQYVEMLTELYGK